MPDPLAKIPHATHAAFAVAAPGLRAPQSMSLHSHGRPGYAHASVSAMAFVNAIRRPHHRWLNTAAAPPSSHHRQHPGGTAGSALVLGRADKDGGALGRKLVETGQILDPVAARGQP